MVSEIEIDDLDDSDDASSPILAILENLFAAVLNGSSHLKSLKFKCSEDLRALDPVLLSQALIRLEECSFWEYSFHSLSTLQHVALFTAIDQTEDLELRVLNLPNEDISEVPPDVLGAGLVKLEETDILSTDLTHEQIRVLFTKIAESPVVNLKKFNSSYSYNIPPQLFADALVRIETVDIIHGNFWVESLLMKIANTEILTLRRLSLSMVDLSQFSPVVVSEAVVKLETLNVEGLYNSGLNEAFFQGIADCLDLRLRGLSVKDINISSVQASVLVGAVSRLEKLSLNNCFLTADQLTGVFTQLSVSEHKLTFLRLSNNRLHSVPTSLLVKALSGLEEVDLYKTSLTGDQLTGIYTMVADRKPGRLRRINLNRNNHSSVPPDLLQRAGLNQSVVINNKTSLRM